MADYPDHTMLTQILGTEITIPITISGATVTLDVDIVAQSVGNIDIDIAAQSVGNLAVNIAAAAVTLDVDVVAQTVGSITIDIEAQSVAVYNPPDWSGLQGDDVDLVGTYSAAGSGSTVVVASRTVTTGKTWVVYAFQAACDGAAGNILGWLWDNTDSVTLSACGGAQGFVAGLPKPILFTAGHVIQFKAIQFTGGNATIFGCVYGYEE